MSSLVGSITFDCARPYELAQFWTEVVGFPIDADSRMPGLSGPSS
jgi:hypothetical protein